MNYNYETLQTFFEDITTPHEIAVHLDLLLYYLVYHQEQEEHRNDFLKIYSDIFDFKRILQNMEKAS